MLNLVPIQFLALLAYFVLRIVIGLVFIYLARTHITHRRVIAEELHNARLPGNVLMFVIIGAELIIGAMFVLGAGTQIAAALALIWALIITTMRSTFSHQSFPRPQTIMLLAAISLSLFITGAGILAFDLPI